MDQTTRAWIYRISVALVPILVAYGLIAEDQASLWIGLAGAVLATGDLALAAAHTSTRPGVDDGHADQAGPTDLR